PARARATSMEHLRSYRHGSFHWLWQPRTRPAMLDLSTALEAAGGLKDTPAGRRSYQQYLVWLQEDEPARKALGFEQMSRGWALGTRDFKRTMVEEHKLIARERSSAAAETREVR